MSFLGLEVESDGFVFCDGGFELIAMNNRYLRIMCVFVFHIVDL